MFGISKHGADSPADATPSERARIAAFIAPAVTAGVAAFGSSHAAASLILSVIDIGAS